MDEIRIKYGSDHIQDGSLR